MVQEWPVGEGILQLKHIKQEVQIKTIKVYLDQGRGGTYYNKGNLVRRRGIRGIEYAPAQPWRAPESNLVTSTGGGTSSIVGASISSNKV